MSDFLVALESVVKAETAEQAIDAAVRETISDFMEEHRVQKHKDNTVVNKVNRLKRRHRGTLRRR